MTDLSGELVKFTNIGDFSLIGIFTPFTGFPGKGILHPVKNLTTMQETQVQSLDWEDPLEEGMVTYSSVLAWRIPWTEEPGGLQSMGSQRVRHD